MQRLRTLPALAAVAALSLSACSSSTSGTGSAATGSGSQAVAEVSVPTDSKALLAQSIAAFKAADSVHLSGTVTKAGTGASGPVPLDISYGKGVSIGTLTISGAPVQVSSTSDGQAYLKAGPDFYKSVGAPDSVITTLAGKYVKVTPGAGGASAAFGDFITLLDKSALADQFDPASKLDQQKVTGPIPVNGVPCFQIGSGADVVSVAVAGAHNLVQINSASNGKLAFSRYGEPVDVPVPTADQIVAIPTG